MEYRIGKCTSCGAEFKVPSSFRHDAARCKVCKGVVRFGDTARSGGGAAGSAKAKGKGSTLDRLKSERGGGSARPAQAAPASRAKAKAKEEAPAPDPAPSAVRKRRAGDRGRPKKKKPAATPVVAAGVVLLLIGGGVFYFRDKLFGSGDAVASTEVAAADPVPAETAPVEEPEPVPDEDPGEAEPVEEEPEPEPPSVDPDSVDLSAIPDFAMVDDTTEEEWAEMTEWMTTWMDPAAGAAGNRAKIKLVEKGRKAFPVFLNHFKTIDFSNEQGMRNGDLVQRTMMEIVNGTNFDWKYTTEPKDVYFNKKVVEAWALHWGRAENNIDYWISFAKLDDKDPTLAADLREKYGDAAETEAQAAGLVDESDDLDVD